MPRLSTEEAKLIQAQKEREERQLLAEQKKDQQNPELIELTALKNQTKDFFRNLEKMCENGFKPLVTVEDYNKLIVLISENK